LAGVAAPHAHPWRIFNTGEVDALFASACFKTSLVQTPVTSIPDTAPGCMRQLDQSQETMGRLHPCCVSIYPCLIIRQKETFKYSCLTLPLRLLSSAFLGQLVVPKFLKISMFLIFSRNFVVNINFKEFLMKFETRRKNISNNKNDKT
jgi:hypothetical protein